MGSVPNGATVEVAVGAHVLGPDQKVTFVLTDPDFTSANRVAAAIDAQMGAGLAEARDASGIEVKVPADERERVVTFLARLENVTVEPDRRAKVVINERTGTVVSGGDVRISPVAISHGDLKVSVTSQNTASQPTNVMLTGAGVRTAIVSRTRASTSTSRAVPGTSRRGATASPIWSRRS